MFFIFIHREYISKIYIYTFVVLFVLLRDSRLEMVSLFSLFSVALSHNEGGS
jgi:hypothetical protein